ncbi:MAG TPA: membrane protein insertase YidC [Terriglobales bacterium]|jgi:YidC/Oxa1 family membrane protein insertase|nr:membrane protein insertase YidC [Terriglobales bacterium]
MAEYQHRPDQGPMGDKNFLLYMVLAFVLVMGLSSLFTKNQPQPPQQPVQPATQSQPASAAPAAKGPSPQSPVATRQAQSEAETVVENGLYKITFTNRGAQVKSWTLKKYKDDKGNPLELVNAPAAAQMGLPLSLWTYDAELRKRLNDALYITGSDEKESSRGAQSLDVKKDSAPVLHLDAPHSLTFDYADQDVVVHKRFSFDHSYVLKVETSVTRNGQPVLAYPVWPCSLGDQQTPAGYATGRMVWQAPEGIQRQAAFEKHFFKANSWVSDGNTIPGPFNWAGVTDQYFAAVFMPANPQSSMMMTLHQPLEIPKDPSNPKATEKEVVHALGLGVANSSGTTQAELFVGPKAVDVLDSVRSYGLNGEPGTGSNLEGVIDFGTFGWFAKLLFRALNWTHDHLVPNWGWAIVVLTFIINLVFLPLRLTQMKTSLKMQKIQPLVQTINKKYEKYGLRDQEKQQQKQQELMALYKTEGVNMYSGCLPLLLQLPILYAFYAVLANTVELRQAGWLWIHDMSAPDPWHLLPVLTIISMVIVQRATPQPGIDAAQRRMMNIMMPLMFGFMTWAVAAGLALYWATSNLISLVQQWAMNQTRLGREIRELQLKRLRKKNK